MKKKIFVVGMPRGGTTLLQNLLLNLPGSYSMPETSFFQFLPDNFFVAPRSLPPFFPFKYPKTVAKKTKERILRFMGKKAALCLSGEDAKKIESLINDEKMEPAVFFEILTNSYARGGEEIVIEKTPVHAYQIDYIKSLFSDAVILGILRDPRDAFVSYNELLDKSGKKRRTIAEFCRLWNGIVSGVKKIEGDVMLYEDLVRQPLLTINGILAKHGLKLNDLNENNYEKIVTVGETWKNLNKSAVTDEHVGLYKKKLSGKEIAEIESRCARQMKKLGYELDRPGRDWLFFLSDFFKWQVEKLKIMFRIVRDYARR